MTKRFIVGSCVAAAGGCVGVGAIIMTSLSSDGSGADALEVKQDANREQQETVNEGVVPPDPNTPNPYSPQEIKTEEKQEPEATEPIDETEDEVDVPNLSNGRSRDQASESDDYDGSLLAKEDEEKGNSGLNEKNSAATYDITGSYPKLKESCDDCSVDWKKLLYFLDMDNSSWDDHMTNLAQAQSYKNNQYRNIENSFEITFSHLYDSKTWSDLLSEYKDWLQNWEKKIRSEEEQKEQWKRLRDNDLDTFQKRERFYDLFKELT